MGLLRFIFILFVIYLFSKLIKILLFSSSNLFGQKKSNEQYNGKREKEGKTTIKHIPKDKNDKSYSKHEKFTDYEDVEE